MNPRYTAAFQPVRAGLIVNRRRPFQPVNLPPTPLTPSKLDLLLSENRRITHVVFDFDGTLSWLRHGWPEMMLHTFAAHMPPGHNATLPETRLLLQSMIMELNGKPTIQQMIRFHRYATELGGSPPDPETLRQAFQDRLDSNIEERSAKIRSGTIEPDFYVVAGAKHWLHRLREKGLRLYVLSSTVEHRVREEAELLGLSEFFEGRINGSPINPEGFTKRAVFERILRDEQISGAQLMAVGDGPVEIADAKALGGAAVAVCSDEAINGSGVCDPLKYSQLLAAGADVAVADFHEAARALSPLLCL